MALVGAIYQALASARDRRRYPPPGQLIDIGGYRLHLYCAGEGSPTVVLDYGLVGSYLDWYFVQPEVARFTRVCSYDRGGYGWSDPSPRPRIPSVMAEELHTLLEKAGEKPPFILVGHSAGALNVRMYAHRYREQVSGMVLVDGAHPDEYLPFYWRKKLWLRFMQFSTPLGLPRWRGWCMEGPAAVRPMKGAFNCQARVYRTNYEEWAAFPQRAQEVRNLGSLGDLPLFVISRDPNRHPREPDEFVLPAREERWTRFQADLAKLSSNSTHVIAKDSGHAVLSERPDVVVEGIRHVVEEVRNKKPTR
jgi:pimeloyl-ACP methyl ester carboxylesterase